jgi:hypothetical protein
VPGDTSIVILSIVTLNNFGASAISFISRKDARCFAKAQSL